MKTFVVTACFQKYNDRDNDKNDVDDKNAADCLGKLHVADRSLEIKSRLEVKNAAKHSTDEKGGLIVAKEPMSL